MSFTTSMRNTSFSNQHEVASISNIQYLAERALSVFDESPQQQCFIAVVGSPGSGKSTITQKLVEKINDITGDDRFSIVVPMDGYHISRQGLQETGELGKVIGDPEATSGETTTYDDLMKRRGAPWTFDPKSLFLNLESTKAKGEGHFPQYEHRMNDPLPDQIHVTKDHRIVFCEGNYMIAFDDPAWRPFEVIWDEKWYLDIPEPVLKRRLVDRDLQHWDSAKIQRYGNGREGAIKKAESNDLKNACWVDRTSKAHADLVIVP